LDPVTTTSFISRVSLTVCADEIENIPKNATMIRF
jgi:hypothetical protein